MRNYLLFLFCFYSCSVLSQSEATNIYEYLGNYSNERFNSEADQLKGDDLTATRIGRVLGQRLYPFGDISVIGAANIDYVNSFYSNTNTTYPATWNSVGPVGIAGSLWGGRTNKVVFDPEYGDMLMNLH